MNYILYGENDYLIKVELNKIINDKLGEDKDNALITYDLNDTNISIILDDAKMPPFLTSHKVIIIKDAYIFTAAIKKGALEHDTNDLEKYLNNDNPDTTLIFITNSEKLDERKKITKLIKQRGICKECNQVSDYNIINIIKKMFDGYQINNNDINYLINRAGKNLLILENEIEKLKLYKYEEKVITKEDIDNLVSKTMEDNIFNLIEMIISKNKEKAIEIYYDMLKKNEEPIKIIVMIANQLRIIYQSKELYKLGNQQNDIAKILGIHPYRIKLALEKSRTYEAQNLLKHIDELGELDYQIKSGQIDKTIALEMFILTI